MSRPPVAFWVRIVLPDADKLATAMASDTEIEADVELSSDDNEPRTWTPAGPFCAAHPRGSLVLFALQRAVALPGFAGRAIHSPLRVTIGPKSGGPSDAN